MDWSWSPPKGQNTTGAKTCQVPGPSILYTVATFLAMCVSYCTVLHAAPWKIVCPGHVDNWHMQLTAQEVSSWLIWQSKSWASSFGCGFIRTAGNSNALQMPASQATFKQGLQEVTPSHLFASCSDPQHATLQAMCRFWKILQSCTSLDHHYWASWSCASSLFTISMWWASLQHCGGSISELKENINDSHFSVWSVQQRQSLLWNVVRSEAPFIGSSV